MDYAITFALLLYINVFYFGLYAVVEFCLLVFKCYQVKIAHILTHQHQKCIFLTYLVRAKIPPWRYDQ